MAGSTTRRAFLGRAAQGAAVGALAEAMLTDWGLGRWLGKAGLPVVGAAEAAVGPDRVRFHEGIEPLVRLLEDTPRDRLLEEVAGRLRQSLGYRDLLAALFLAGIRNVQPRPNVGFKFHSVLVVHSAHLASMTAPHPHRWLPIFWALDYFKKAQADDVAEGDWTMAAVAERGLPEPRKALESFVRSMEKWDEAGADAAIASLARAASAAELFEPLWRFGMRDFRAIGHKAIYVANSWRTLHAIGFHHAEPVARSLAYALLQHEGSNPAERDAPADLPWRRNVPLAARIPEGWLHGKPDAAASAALLALLRQGSEEDAAKEAAAMLGRGVAPRSLWDAFFAAAAELCLRQSGIVSLHAATTANALHHAFEMSGVDETRKLAILQCASFLVLFREALTGRGAVGDARFDALAAAPASATTSTTLGEVFATAGDDRAAAVRQALAYLEGGGSPYSLADAARLLVFLKGNDAHDYKFSSAVLEDYTAIGEPAWRNRFLASSLTLLKSSKEPDSPLVERTRAALGV